MTINSSVHFGLAIIQTPRFKKYVERLENEEKKDTKAVLEALKNPDIEGKIKLHRSWLNGDIKARLKVQRQPELYLRSGKSFLDIIFNLVTTSSTMAPFSSSIYNAIKERDIFKKFMESA